jgi:type I restriction enzyme S subunit
MSWIDLKLGEVATFSQGLQVPTEKHLFEKEEGSVRFVRIVDYTNEKEPPRYIKVENYKKYFVDEDDIVMIRYGSQTAGKVARGISGVIANNTFKIKVNHPDIDKNYLFHYLNQVKIYKTLNSNQSSSTMPAVSFGMVKKLSVPVPPLKSQKQIADILSDYDDLIANNLKRIKLLEQAAHNIFKEWFVNMHFPGHQDLSISSKDGIHSGWTVKKLYDVFTVKYGKNLSKSHIKTAGEYPVYGASGIIGYYTLANTHLKAALITSRGNGSGDVHRTFHSKAFVTNNSFVVTPKEQYSFIPLSYTTELLNTLNLKNYCSGSAQPQLTNAAMKNITFVFPEPALIKAFSEIVSPILSQCDLLRKQNHKLNEAKDILLPRLMNQTIKV